jgi:predicted transcriptional regulator
VHNVRYLKVEGHTGLVRDTSTGAILNTNRTEYENYLKQKEAVENRLLESKQISQHTEDINNIKTEISEIKQMLLLLIKDR